MISANGGPVRASSRNGPFDLGGRGIAGGGSGGNGRETGGAGGEGRSITNRGPGGNGGEAGSAPLAVEGVASMANQERMEKMVTMERLPFQMPELLAMVWTGQRNDWCQHRRQRWRWRLLRGRRCGRRRRQWTSWRGRNDHRPGGDQGVSFQ